MRLRVLPLIPRFNDSKLHVFPQADHQLVVVDHKTAEQEARRQLSDLEVASAGRASFLEAFAGTNDECAEHTREMLADIDAVIVFVSSTVNEEIFSLPLPVLLYSGEKTPMMPLYHFPQNMRRRFPNTEYCLETKDVLRRLSEIRMVSIRKRMQSSRMLILGEYRCSDRVPDPEVVKERFGMDLVHLAAEEFFAELETVKASDAERRAASWVGGALEVVEPDSDDVLEAARIHEALERIVEREKADAVSVGCTELMAKGRRPFCFVLAEMRDVGLPAGCEGDATATLTLLLLEHIAERPGYMGNTVMVDRELSHVSISHGCSPSRMFGRNAAAKGYKLVHSHSAPPYSRDLTGGSGLTSYVDYGEDAGHPVTIARLNSELSAMLISRGTIVDCKDTICDRTTLTVAVPDAAEFVQLATGNHQVVVYGDYVDELRTVCIDFGIEPLEVGVGAGPDPIHALEGVTVGLPV